MEEGAVDISRGDLPLTIRMTVQLQQESGKTVGVIIIRAVSDGIKIDGGVQAHPQHGSPCGNEIALTAR